MVIWKLFLNSCDLQVWHMEVFVTFLKEKLTNLTLSPQKWKGEGKFKMYKFNRDGRIALSVSLLGLLRAGRERMS